MSWRERGGRGPGRGTDSRLASDIPVEIRAGQQGFNLDSCGDRGGPESVQLEMIPQGGEEEKQVRIRTSGNLLPG